TGRPEDTWLRSIAVGALIACGALLAALFVADWIRSWRVETRKHDAEIVVPLIDEYRRRTGSSRRHWTMSSATQCVRPAARSRIRATASSSCCRFVNRRWA